jgi:hypothetical protein
MAEPQNLNGMLEEGTGYAEPQMLVRRDDDLVLMPAFDLTVAKERLAELQEFVKFYLKEGEDYGTIPGTPKPTLFKPGADKLCDIYALADRYRITNRTEDWERNLFDYEVECTLVSRRTERMVATGLGSCNSYEENYRWRERKRKCPKCQKETIIKGKEEYGGGWLCWKKEGGCGAKWPDGAKEIEGQETGKIENPNIPTLKNTFLKMAKKRAKIDAVLSATRSSGIFTQDIEDWTVVDNGSEEAAQEVAKAKVEAAHVPSLFWIWHSESEMFELVISQEIKKKVWPLVKKHWLRDACVGTHEELQALKKVMQEQGIPFSELEENRGH